MSCIAAALPCLPREARNHADHERMNPSPRLHEGALQQCIAVDATEILATIERMD